MSANPQRPKRRDGTLSALNVAIDAMNLAKEAMSMTPAKGVFGSVSILLTMIKVRFPPLSDDLLEVHMWTGFHDQRNRLR